MGKTFTSKSAGALSLQQKKMLRQYLFLTPTQQREFRQNLRKTGFAELAKSLVPRHRENAVCRLNRALAKTAEVEPPPPPPTFEEESSAVDLPSEDEDGPYWVCIDEEDQSKYYLPSEDAPNRVRIRERTPGFFQAMNRYMKEYQLTADEARDAVLSII